MTEMSTVAPSAVQQEASGGTGDRLATAPSTAANYHQEQQPGLAIHVSANASRQPQQHQPSTAITGISTACTTTPSLPTRMGTGTGSASSELPTSLSKQQIHEMKTLRQASSNDNNKENHSSASSPKINGINSTNATSNNSADSLVRSGHISPSLSSTPSSPAPPFAGEGGEGSPKDKTPMCLVNELARFNNVQHQYRLVEEQGPPHKKTFTVMLKLGAHEEYTATGSSIKRARHSAAQTALQKTGLRHPTPKAAGKGSNGPLTPTVELNALAMKRGEPAVYRVVEIPRLASAYLPTPLGYNRTPCTGPALYGPHAVHGLGHSGHSRYHPHFPPRLPPSYRAILDVGERKFIGEGNTEQAARHSAAEVALATLRQLPLPASATRRSAVALSDDDDDEGKSAISVVYEMALKRNLQVDFEVIAESGPPHMRKYITRCQVGTIAVTEGCGNGKKLSKKEAAEKMVVELRKLAPVMQFCQTGQQHQTATNQRGKNNGGSVETSMATTEKKKAAPKKKSKNLVKEQRPDGTFYGQGINPISRLIQIQQAKKEKEPAYSVVAERGEPRSREFVIQCSLDGGMVATQGTGPNKKTAKRKAAEAMLQQLGYAKPVAQQAGGASNKDERENVDTSNMNGTSSGGKSGSGHCRQLAPGLLVVSKGGKESKTEQTRGKNVHTDKQAAIAKELLDSGVSPTAIQVGNHQGHQNKERSTNPGANRQTSAMTAGGGSDGDGNSNTGPQGSLIKAKDQLSYLAQVLGIQVSFMNFPKGSEFLSLVALTSNPPQQCHGSGRTVEEAQDNAAHSILVTLAQLGIDSIQANNNNNNNGKKNEGNKTAATTTA